MKIENLKEGLVVKNYKQLCEMLEIKASTGASKMAQMKELERYVKYHKEGNKFIIDEIYEVAQDKVRKERVDKGVTRDDYNTIKEKYKTLIYILILKMNNSYVGSFNNWMEYAQITNKNWKKINNDFFAGKIHDDELRNFIKVEGKSLRSCFIGALESMTKEGSIEWGKNKMAILDRYRIEEDIQMDLGEDMPDISYKLLDEDEKNKVIQIEMEVCSMFGITQRRDLVFGKKDKRIDLEIKRDLQLLKEFDKELSRRLFERFGYSACFDVFDVIGRVGESEETILNTIEMWKNKYGIKEDIQETIKECKDEIYKSRLKRAEARGEKKQLLALERGINGLVDGEIIDIFNQKTQEDIERTCEEYVGNWSNMYKDIINSNI